MRVKEFSFKRYNFFHLLSKELHSYGVSAPHLLLQESKNSKFKRVEKKCPVSEISLSTLHN